VSFPGGFFVGAVGGAREVGAWFCVEYPVVVLGLRGMGNFISDQLVKFLNQRMTGIGAVDALDVGHDAVVATVSLQGETEPVRLELSGIRWSTGDGQFHLHFQIARASKEWMQGLLNILAEKTGKRISLPDKFSLAPLKMLFPKA
jgi:hypothetical protein